MKNPPKELSLAYLNPKLAKEWDYEKNFPLTPNDVFIRGSKKFGWICKDNHSYYMTIHDRIRGRYCPYCSGKKVCIDNCLATLNPELAKEWHPTKNGKLTPYDVVSNSGKIVWWKCKNGHEWRQKISSRNKPGCGCPCCSGHKVCKENCLATLRPHLAKEWDYEKNYPLTPEDVTQWCNKKVYWICPKCKHSYDIKISDRSRGQGRGQDCSYCASKRVCIENCLATKRPDLIKEWHPTKNGKLTPYDVTCGSHKIVWWIDKKGHEWTATPHGRVGHGSGCPYCSNPPKMVCKDNCLATVNPWLSREWNYKKNGKLTPYNVTAGSNIKVWWICKCGHEWMASICSRNSEGHGCLSCVKNKIKLKNGIVCDSLPEAHYCQKELIDKSIKFEHHIKIGLGKHTCDFYIDDTNTYVDVTGFTRHWKYWKKYLKGIARKRKHVTKALGAKYVFIKIKLTPKQLQYVRDNMI